MAHFRIQTTDGNGFDFDADKDQEMVVIPTGDDGVIAIKDSNQKIVVAIPLRNVHSAFKSDAPKIQ